MGTCHPGERFCAVHFLGLLFLIVAGAIPAGAMAQEPFPGARAGRSTTAPTAQDESSARTTYDQLIRRREALLLQYQHIVAGKSTKRRRDETFLKYYPHPEDWAPRFFAVYRAYPGTVSAARSLVWIVTHWRDSELDYQCREILFQHYISQPFLDEVCRSLSHAKQPRAKKDLQFLFDNSPVEAVKGRACLVLCELALDELEVSDSPTLRASTEEYVKLLDSKFAAVKMGRMAGAQWAARYRLVLDHLSLGQKVLDWTATDLNGQSRSLADTRGQVVLLFFWKSKSRPTRLALPRVQSLINKYKDAPFSVFGVSGDLDRERSVRWQKTLQVQFPSWHVPSSLKEPGVWGVTSWPCFFVLSPKGRILAARTDWKEARQVVADAMEQLRVESEGKTPPPAGDSPPTGDDSSDPPEEPGSDPKPTPEPEKTPDDKQA